tara:strand:- start:4677 stop:5267 length:591 start_codon:yes stop_codon:yes gene_type:complete
MCKILTYVIVVCLATGVFASPTISYEKIENTSEKMISSSYQTPDTEIKTGKVTAIINFNHKLIVSQLLKYDNYEKFLPFITKSKIRSTNNDVSSVSISAKVMKGLVNIDALVIAKHQQNSNLSDSIAINLKSGDLKKMNILFTVEKVSPEKSILTTHFMIEPNIWLVSNKTFSRYNQVNARRTVRSLRSFLREVKS